MTSPLDEEKGNFVISDEVATSLFLADIEKEIPASYVILANNLYSAQTIYENLLNYFPEDNLAFFPSDELLRSEVLSSSYELMSQRLYAMGQLLNKGNHILITHPSALMRFLPSKETFKSHTLLLQKGNSYSLEKIKLSLLEMGYKRVNKVDQSLQFALRGDILDVYSVNLPYPVRIEFFDDVIEEIKYFDIPTQSSTNSISSVYLLSATEYLLSKEEKTNLVTKIDEKLEEEGKKLPSDIFSILKENTLKDIEDLLNGSPRSSLYRYFAYGREEGISILDYIDARNVIVMDKDGFLAGVETLEEDANKYLKELKDNHLILPCLREYLSLNEALGENKKVLWCQKFISSPLDQDFKVRPVNKVIPGIAGIVPAIEYYLNERNKVVISLSEPHQRETIKTFLKEAKLDFEEVKDFNLPKGKLGIGNASLKKGFEIPASKIVYFSSSDLFGGSYSSSRFSSRFKNATILKSYEELKPGDYIVHEANGIGQFLEIVTLENEGIHRDYLKIGYANNEILYVPLEQFRLVRKYAGREGARPTLSHLFSGDWEKKKKKIKERVNLLAERLIALYGNRAKEKGFAFPKDDEMQDRFEREFPFPLTVDQQKSLEEIKADMEKDEPMDRLLCGDVGFGKTEVAFRAAFKAVSAGKQVALLCPTTLLARQHYEVALERFATFGVRISLLSRLVPSAIQKSAIKSIEEGTTDLIIGTHRLLSKDVRYKNLGLLIVDEEQRFGVEQKEKIKEIKQNVDVLTLSATPIPRTLQMSLIGIRALSEINSAPARRMPIQTYVTPYKGAVAIELIQRELSRNGQVFYVYNKVFSIYSKASELARALPNAKIGVVHGKMEKEEIEDTMEKFYNGEINLLICTSIVENGIDVPNANMIIVEDADHFGLSQLYQIKGRVGRGDRIAYAYLMYRPNDKMNEDAVKRLKAIEEFTELGSGYKIAQRDLMIRGAGDILGPEQAGFIDTVGLDLYLKLLGEAIENKKQNILEDTPQKANSALSLDAYIPKNYANTSDKIELYQTLENTKSEDEVDKFENKVRDIYGRLPKEMQLLLKKRKMDVLLSSDAFEGLEELRNHIDIRLSSLFSSINGIGLELFNVLTPYLNKVEVTYVEKRLRLRLKKENDWPNDLYKILKEVSSLHEKRTSGKIC